jgi:hypothetical protein
LGRTAKRHTLQRYVGLIEQEGTPRQFGRRLPAPGAKGL